MRKAAQLDGHDYSGVAVYFVTVCTEARQYLLGHKEEGSIVLTLIGEQVKRAWNNIGTRYEGIELGEYVVMPNHLHGILSFTEGNRNRYTLQDVIRDFKSYTTHLYHQDKFRLTGNLWQKRFHEHIIRSNEFEMIRKYIYENPANWENDKLYDLERSSRRMKGAFLQM